MANKQFEIGQIVSLPVNMTGTYAGVPFHYGGNVGLHKNLKSLGEECGYFMNESTIIPVSGKVIEYSEYNYKEKCYQIKVEWINPFIFECKPIIVGYAFNMLESEFSEFIANNHEKQTEFKIGDWVYYMGAEAGGVDTGADHWVKGLVGKITKFDGYGYYNFDCIGKMKNAGNNSCAFRAATLQEISEANHLTLSTLGNVGKSTVDTPIYTSLSPNSTYDHSVTLHFKRDVQELQNNVDETKVSFQSKQLVANKINNSKEINDFLLIN